MNADNRASLRAPSLGLLLTEPARAALEFVLLGPSLPLLLAAPRGDGHPVMVIPGMAASDRSTVVLRRFLGLKGYAVYGWDQGRNDGSPALMKPLLERIRALRALHEPKVSLVGWSLGGIYARELAKLAPDHVRFVITLGSPFRGPSRASNVWHVYEALSGERADHPDDRYAPAPPQPTTAVLTRGDGIVPWQRCAETPGARAESVEVLGSHSGLGHNALALYVVADRLAQAEGTWQPFAPRGALRLLYRYPWQRGST